MKCLGLRVKLFCLGHLALVFGGWGLYFTALIQHILDVGCVASTLLTLQLLVKAKLCLLCVATMHDGNTVNKVHAVKVIKPSCKVKSRRRRDLLERVKSLSQVVKPRLLFQGNYYILCLQRETVQLAFVVVVKKDF